MNTLNECKYILSCFEVVPNRKNHVTSWPSHYSSALNSDSTLNSSLGFSGTRLFNYKTAAAHQFSFFSSLSIISYPSRLCSLALRKVSWFGLQPSAASCCKTLAHLRHPAARLALVNWIAPSRRPQRTSFPPRYMGIF